ncbi:MAG: DUF4833 domain-containing protein [Alphaproteobacteria bacterium]|nr:DUF4833 domain-containing protein [Alphaproteobacteria bacterium]
MNGFRAAARNAIRAPVLAALLAFVPFVAGGASEARDLERTVTELDHLPPPPGPKFRTPTDPNMLFFLQRSSNANTVVYAARLTSGGKLDPNTPVEVFWRRYEEDGRRRGLNFVERTSAYGIDVHAVSGESDAFDANIVALPQLGFRIAKYAHARPQAVISIDGRLARLTYVYLAVDDSGFLPSVVSADIYAIEQSNGHVLRERLVPKKG